MQRRRREEKIKETGVVECLVDLLCVGPASRREMRGGSTLIWKTKRRSEQGGRKP